MIRTFGMASIAACFLVLSMVALGSTKPETTLLAHPEHGAPFPEQLAGQWSMEDEDKEGPRLRFYEDGRFAFFDGKDWTAGSYFILRSDERQKGVLRLEYYLDGNLHFEEIRCEVHFETHTDDHEHANEEAEGHHHEYLRVEVLNGAEQALKMSGEYLHVH
jgi:hypothetical protein